MTTSSQQIYFRQRNKTFYTDLERLHQVLVSPGLRVLEVGCGTGDLLAQLKPSHGVGIELDPEVAAVARERRASRHDAVGGDPGRVRSPGTAAPGP